jgi:hypothetical protein
MSMNISESKNAPLLLFSVVDVRDFTATLVETPKPRPLHHDTCYSRIVLHSSDYNDFCF